MIKVGMGVGPEKHPLDRQFLSLTVVSTVLNAAEVLSSNV